MLASCAQPSVQPDHILTAAAQSIERDLALSMAIEGQMLVLDSFAEMMRAECDLGLRQPDLCKSFSGVEQAIKKGIAASRESQEALRKALAVART